MASNIQVQVEDRRVHSSFLTAAVEPFGMIKIYQFWPLLEAKHLLWLEFIWLILIYHFFPTILQ